MRPLRPLFAIALLASLVGRAHADEADDARKAADRLVLEGKKLGDSNRVMEAIERFKAAEAKYPRAIHGCNIGLAYAQLNVLPKALFFLENCRQRATGPLPDWVENRYRKTLDAMRTSDEYAALEIITDPRGVEVQVLGFARDETFMAPRTVWLTAGEVELLFTRDGYVTQRQTVTLKRPGQRLVVKLDRVPPPIETPPQLVDKPVEKPSQPPITQSPPPPRGRLSFKIAGGVIVGVGAVVMGTVWIPSYQDWLAAEAAIRKDDPTTYTAFYKVRDRVKNVEYPAIFVPCSLVVLTGVGLLVAGHLLPASKSAAVSVGASPTRGGGLVSVEGRF